MPDQHRADTPHAPETTLAERAAARRQRIVVHRTTGFAEADQWDLAYWQSRTPEERLSALVAIHRDVALVQHAARERMAKSRIDEPRHQEDARVLREVKKMRLKGLPTR